MTLEGSLKGSVILLGLTVRRRHSEAAFEARNLTVPVSILKDLTFTNSLLNHTL